MAAKGAARFAPTRMPCAGRRGDGGSMQGIRGLPLRLRVHLALENRGLLQALDAITALLAVVTVITYIISTYGSVTFEIFDLFMGCIFAAEWLFRVWTAPSRVAFILSWWSFIDIVSFVPMIVLAALKNTAIGTSAVRLFRLLRVLRVIRTARVLPVKVGEISMKLISLCLTMVILILLAAGIFYELEASDGFGSGDTPLQFHDSIYWAAVTLSTVGYGDIHPTSWQTQLLFIILMMMLVTLVPYQSSALIEAVLDYSHYQRVCYTRKPLQSHVIITGQFDHITLETVLTELFHEDNGQRQFDAVVLGPKTPTSQMKLLVASHIHGPVQAQYIQGTPLNPKDLERCKAQYADAIIILANKYSSSPEEEDSRSIMTLMAAGQALFHAHRQPLPEEKGFRDVPWLLWRLWDRIRGMQKTGPPRIFVQLILPSSRDRLQDALHVLQTEQQAAASGGHSASSSRRSSSSGGQDATAPVLDSASEATAWVQYDAHKAGQGEGAQQRQHSSAQPADSEELAARPSPLVAVWKWLSAQVWRVLLHLVQEESAMAAGQERGSRQSQEADAAVFWYRFERSVSVLCVKELKESLLGLSCLGSRGLVSLLANLCRAHNGRQLGPGAEKHISLLQGWQKEYLASLDSEIYELPAFPDHLLGRTFREAAQQLFLEERVLLLGLGVPDSTGARDCELLPLGRTIQAGMSGYAICSHLTQLTDLLMRPSAKRSSKHAAHPLQHHKHRQHQQQHEEMQDVESARDQQPYRPIELQRARTMSLLRESFVARSGPSAIAPISTQHSEDYLRRVTESEHELLALVRAGSTIGCLAPSSTSTLLREPLQPGQREQLEGLYHLREDWQSVEGKDLEVERVEASGHVLVLGGAGAPDALLMVVAPFRSRHLRRDKLLPIVIVDLATPSGPTWDELAQFPDVHLIHGSPLSGRDLARASAASAARAIVFPHMAHPMDSCTALEQQSLRDADVVFAVQKLRKLQPEIEVLAELVNPAHMAFLSPGRAVQGLGSIALYMLPVYASGQVYVSSMLDSLIVQSFFNRCSDKILHQLLSGWHSTEDNSQRVLLVNVPVSSHPGCATFADLFIELLSQRSMLCIALYRTAAAAAHGAGSAVQYVLTRPRPDTPLQAGDEAMVLVQLPGPRIHMPGDVKGFDNLDGSSFTPGRPACAESPGGSRQGLGRQKPAVPLSPASSLTPTGNTGSTAGQQQQQQQQQQQHDPMEQLLQLLRQQQGQLAAMQQQQAVSQDQLSRLHLDVRQLKDKVGGVYKGMKGLAADPVVVGRQR